MRIIYYFDVLTQAFHHNQNLCIWGVSGERKKNQSTKVGHCYEIEPHGNLSHFPKNCFDLNSMLLKRGSHFCPWGQITWCFQILLYKHEYFCSRQRWVFTTVPINRCWWIVEHELSRSGSISSF